MDHILSRIRGLIKEVKEEQPSDRRDASRARAITITKLEEAEMWYQKVMSEP